MKKFLVPSMSVALLTFAAISSTPASAQQTNPIRVGVNTAIQAQVGRGAIDSVKVAIDEINARGGVLGPRCRPGAGPDRRD